MITEFCNHPIFQILFVTEINLFEVTSKKYLSWQILLIARFVHLFRVNAVVATQKQYIMTITIIMMMFVFISTK